MMMIRAPHLLCFADDDDDDDDYGPPASPMGPDNDDGDDGGLDDHRDDDDHEYASPASPKQIGTRMRKIFITMRMVMMMIMVCVPSITSEDKRSQLKSK